MTDFLAPVYILAAARACGCDAVYSEDMSCEQDYDGLRVINPFASSTEAEVKAARRHRPC